MKITDIALQKHNKNRMSVFVDGEYSFSLADTDIILMGIKIGKEITQEEIAEYNERCNYTKALSLSLDTISRKAATKKQITDKLKKAGYDQQIISGVCEELSSMGYMDDVEYARSYAKDAITYKKLGKEKIVMELKLRGVKSEDISEALCDMDFNSEDNIAEMLERKFEREDFSLDKTKQKAMRYLMYRGFSASDSREGIQRFLMENSEE